MTSSWLIIATERSPWTLLAWRCFAIAIVGLWIRSAWRVDHVLVYTTERRLELTSAPHALQLGHFGTSEVQETTILRTSFAPGSPRDQLWRFDALEPGAGFEVETNAVTILGRNGTRIDVPLASKAEVAEAILDAVEGELRRNDGTMEGRAER